MISADELDIVARVVRDLTGITLDATKSYLIESRLERFLKSEHCKSYSELARRVQSMPGSALQTEFIDAITTNETLFFRDRAPYEALQHKLIPELIDARAHSVFPRRLKIWSAACSTGQEPYSIAMTMRELIPDIDKWDITIFATDISDAAIRTASRGFYTAYETERGLTPQYLSRYFVGEGQQWRVRDEVRYMVRFMRMNLLVPFGSIGPFDVIFCRNVAIYFDEQAKADLFRRLNSVLQPDGILIVGSGENPGPLFEPQYHCRTIVYKRSKLANASTPSNPAAKPIGTTNIGSSSLGTSPASSSQQPLIRQSIFPQGTPSLGTTHHPGKV